MSKAIDTGAVAPPAAGSSGQILAGPVGPAGHFFTGGPTAAPTEYVTPETAQVPELARICFNAFGQLHDTHGVPRDFPTYPVAEKAIGLLVSRPEIFGVAVRREGQLAGSNFLTEMDEVGGVGPISVEPSGQGRGLGRGLMEQVLARAEQRGRTQLRLLQETINPASLSLYTSLGFAVREPLGLMTIAPAMKADPAVRLAVPEDLPAMEQLGRRLYKTGRRGELEVWLSLGFPVLVHEQAGKVASYFMPGKLGHGVADSVEVALALIGEGGRRVPYDTASFVCPLREEAFYRAALRAGHRVAKILTYMTRGPYEAPQGVWLPSYLY